jgi:hypothetical protein
MQTRGRVAERGRTRAPVLRLPDRLQPSPPAPRRASSPSSQVPWMRQSSSRLLSREAPLSPATPALFHSQSSTRFAPSLMHETRVRHVPRVSRVRHVAVFLFESPAHGLGFNVHYVSHMLALALLQGARPRPPPRCTPRQPLVAPAAHQRTPPRGPGVTAVSRHERPLPPPGPSGPLTSLTSLRTAALT